MKKYSYKVVEERRELDQKELNKIGSQGWELVSVSDFEKSVGEMFSGTDTYKRYVFKRIKKQ